MPSEKTFQLLTQDYTLVLATNKEDFRAVKEVREEVFSQKYNISPTLLESKGYLFNEDDEQSFIYLLQHQASKKYVGTVRVFFINERTPVHTMPMQKDGNVKNIEHLRKDLPICEISRLALVNTLQEHEYMSALRLRTNLSLSLMCAARINFFLYHYLEVFAIMESSLHRLLRRQGVNFEQIGESVDYYGMCTPFAIERKKLLEETEDTMEKLTRYYLKDLCNNPEKFWEFIDNNPYLERSDIQLDKICRLFEEYGDDVDLSLLLEEKEVEPIA